jgi:hypothetical protein
MAEFYRRSRVPAMFLSSRSFFVKYFLSNFGERRKNAHLQGQGRVRQPAKSARPFSTT